MIWKNYKLDELGFIGRGKSKHRPRNDVSLYGGDYPFVQTSDVKSTNLYLTEYSQTYNEQGLAQSKLWEVGTLCITIAANIAETAILGIEACFPDSIVGFVANPDKSDARFIKYYIDTIKIEIQNISQGTTQDNLSIDKLLTFDFRVPPASLQCKIASILSTYDDLIENNTRRIKILEEMAKIIYDEWFVKFRFPGHENVKMVESEMGLIPEGWEMKSVLNTKYWTLIGENLGKYSGKKEYLATANVNGNEIIKDGEWFIYEEKPIRAQKQPVIYSVWFARMRETYKVLGFTNANGDIVERGILSSGFAGLKASIDSFPFLYFMINSEKFHELKDKFCTGATQMALTNEGMSRIEILIPKADIVEKYSRLALSFIEEILILQRQNKNLTKTRNLLLPKLINGEIDVENLEINIENDIGRAS